MNKFRVILYFLAFIFVSTSSYAQWDLFSNTQNQGKAELQTNNTGSIQWKMTEFNFGDIKQNVPVKIEFEFTNTGNQPIIITKAEASCGCTELKYSVEPVLPGKRGSISTVYDAKSLGTFQKTITVNLNLDAPHNVFELKLSGNVKIN